MMLLLLACAQPVHLQYDYGRAIWEAQRLQADLSRPSVAQSLYPLSGNEAATIRSNAEQSAGDEESGEQEAIEQ
jgi:hypothetical protein